MTEGRDQAIVECHAGYTYPERPIALHWQGERCVIEQVLSEWRVPDGKVFRVRVRDGRVFTLYYREWNDEWRVEPV